MEKYSMYRVIRYLAFYYCEAVKDPSREQFLASALVRPGNSPKAPDNTSLSIGYQLESDHFKINEVDKEYGPKNTYLLESLLSGLSLKHDFGASADMLAAIDDGLDAPPHDSDESEVLVVGACIQLLLNGSKMVTNYVASYGKRAVVALKLKDHAAVRTVKDPHAIQVLQ